MRLGSPQPLPRWAWPTSGIAMIVGGLVVMTSVGQLGGVFVGGLMVVFGILRLLPPQNGPQRPAEPPHSTFPLSAGQREKITIERHRERRTRERDWLED